MNLSTKQKHAIKNATKRLNIWEGAVRSGKTFSSILTWIRYIGNAPEGGDLIMTGKSQGSLKRNIINPMKDLLGDEVRHFVGKNEVRLWGKTIYCFGAYDESSEGIIRGMTVAGAYGDELTLWPESYWKMMLSRMSIDDAQFFGSTNPDNPYHYLKKDYIDRCADLDMTVFHFELDDNPGLSLRFKNNLKKEYVGLWYKRFIQGLWVAAEGAIYDFFDEHVHVKQPWELPTATDRTVGIDYGTNNPTAFLLFGENHTFTKPRVWAEDEYYYDSKEHSRQKTDDEYAEDFVKFIKPYPNVSRAYIDPSAASFKLALQKSLTKAHRFVQIIDAENDVVNGIRTQGTMLANGDYVISSKCKRTIKDYYGYCWDAKQQMKGIDAPLKTCGADHTKDGERYKLHTSYGLSTSINYNKLLSQ